MPAPMKRSPLTIAAGVLALAGLASLGLAAAAWIRGGQPIDEWTAKMAAHKSEHKAARVELSQVNLRYQAFQKSLPAVPDSIRKVTGGEIRDEGRKYEKQIHKLEMTSRDLELDMIRDQRKLAEATAARKESALPYTAAGAGAWACAAILAVASRRRRNAA